MSSSATRKSWVLVTGGGSGIGRALARHLANQSLHVMIVGRRLAPLEETRGTALRDRFLCVEADVATPEGRERVASEMEKNNIRSLKYLIHNAGIVGPLVPLSGVDLEGFRKTMAVNVEAPVFLTQRLLKLLVTEHSETGQPARILHVSSGCAHNPSTSWLTYCVSKAALLMVYRQLALEFDELKTPVLVGSFKPGIVDSGMQDEMRQAPIENFPKVDFFKKLKHVAVEKSSEVSTTQPRLPLRDRLDTPENVAHFAWWLLSKSSDKEFQSQDWDIRDEETAKRWL